MQLTQPVSILTGPEEPVQQHGWVSRIKWEVSILTGPEEPVQRLATARVAVRILFLILTGPEEPVQRRRALCRQRF